jgi:hypothetical protein
MYDQDLARKHRHPWKPSTTHWRSTLPRNVTPHHAHPAFPSNDAQVKSAMPMPCHVLSCHQTPHLP